MTVTGIVVFKVNVNGRDSAIDVERHFHFDTGHVAPVVVAVPLVAMNASHFVGSLNGAQKPQKSRCVEQLLRNILEGDHFLKGHQEV